MNWDRESRTARKVLNSVLDSDIFSQNLPQIEDYDGRRTLQAFPDRALNVATGCSEIKSWTAQLREDLSPEQEAAYDSAGSLVATQARAIIKKRLSGTDGDGHKALQHQIGREISPKVIQRRREEKRRDKRGW